MTEQEEQVWTYLLNNRNANVQDVAESLEMDEDFVRSCMDRIGSENWREPVDGGADSVQVGGSHYKDMPLQPWTVMEALLTREEFIGFLKGSIIKYSMRQGHKGADDGGKGNHYIAKLKEVMRQA